MRKFIVSFFGILALALIFVIPVFAATPDEVKILPAGETIDRDYFSIGERSEINGTVNGDAYVLAGEVVITGEINGDLLAAGGNVIVSGEIDGDVRVAGGVVTFSGAEISGNITVLGGSVTLDSSTVIGGSIVAGAGNLQVFSPIGKGAHIGGGNVMIASSIGDDVQVGATNISLSPGSEIDGKFTYYSENEANISTDASVTGEIKHELPKQGTPDAVSENLSGKDVGRNAGLALAGIVYAIKIIDTFWLIIFGLLMIYMMPKFTHKTAEFATKKIGWALLTGFLVLITVPIVGTILMFTLVGIPISLLLLFFYLLIFWVGRIFTIYAIGLVIVNRFSKKHHRGGAFMLGMIIYILLSLIPIFGFFVTLVVSLAGVGALVITKGRVYRDLRAKNLI